MEHKVQYVQRLPPLWTQSLSSLLYPKRQSVIRRCYQTSKPLLNVIKWNENPTGDSRFPGVGIPWVQASAAYNVILVIFPIDVYWNIYSSVICFKMPKQSIKSTKVTRRKHEQKITSLTSQQRRGWEKINKLAYTSIINNCFSPTRCN